jgi:hypothetical protein
MEGEFKEVDAAFKKPKCAAKPLVMRVWLMININIS